MSLPDANNIALIRQMMDTLGVSAADLVSAATDPPVGAPTVEAFYTTVLALATDGQRRTYANHWRSLVEAHGDRPVNSLRKTELEALAQAAKKNARTRANSRKGSGAQENCVAALRHFFAKAVDDGLLRENPALKLAKPKRQASHRRPLKPEEVEQLWTVTVTTGNDPALDALLFRFHLETGARRGGALALRVRDLDRKNQTVLLREKGETERWAPVSATLLDALEDHAASRGATAPDDALFRYQPGKGAVVGRPLTYRRYDNLYARWQAALPWADQVHVSATGSVTPRWPKSSGSLGSAPLASSLVTATRARPPRSPTSAPTTKRSPRLPRCVRVRPTRSPRTRWAATRRSGPQTTVIDVAGH